MPFRFKNELPFEDEEKLRRHLDWSNPAIRDGLAHILTVWTSEENPLPIRTTSVLKGRISILKNLPSRLESDLE